MNLLNLAIDASRGIGDANYNQKLREGNRDANLGINYYLSCVTQYSLVENTFNKVNEILQKVKFTTISHAPSLLTCSIALFIPLSLTLAKKSFIFTNYPIIHNLITTIDNDILPTLILLTNLVASVAYIVFGSQIYGSFNLLFLLLNLLHEKGWMNTDFIQKNVIINGILELCIITKATHALLINHSLNPYYLWILADKTYQAKNYIRKPARITISPITLREYESRYSESTDVAYSFHQYHLWKEPVSSHPLEDLTHQFDQYSLGMKEYLQQDLSIYNLKLLYQFRNEEKWILDYNNNPIDYLNHGINSFLHAIAISNNVEFKNKSLGIIRYILSLPKDEQIDRVANLAITGHYCPERLYNDTNLLYDTYIDTLESRDLSAKIIGILHGERLQILDQFLASINQAKSSLNSMITSIPNTNDLQSRRQRLSNLLLQVFSSLVPPMDDIHFANSMKNILCPYLYAHRKSIDTLTEVDTKNLTWSLLNWFYQKNGFIGLIESIFSQQYSPNIIFKRISHIIEKEPILSTFEIEQWFIEQYMSDYVGANRSRAEEWLREKVYCFDDDYNPKIKPYYILFFLVNHGVLKIEDNPNFVQEPKK